MEALTQFTPGTNINHSLVLLAQGLSANQRWVLSIWTNQSPAVPASRAGTEFQLSSLLPTAESEGYNSWLLQSDIYTEKQTEFNIEILEQLKKGELFF